MDESGPLPGLQSGDAPGPPAGEARRHLVVLFTDLSDSTHLSGAMEAETYAAMLDDVRRVFRTAVEARGGVVNQFQGDGLQALFGHPEPGENDSRHAADAALEVHERVRALRERYAAEGAPALSVHSGIHAGSALARRGDDVAGRIEVFGPAPGIAKHLSDAAEADEILASDEALGPAAHLFTTDGARSLVLKGRSDALPVRRIVAATARRTRFEAHTQRGLARFVGRRAERARLAALWDDVRRGGRHRLVVIAGPAGLGKTRLAEEFLREVADEAAKAAGPAAGPAAASEAANAEPAAPPAGAILRGHCGDELSAEPLQPFVQMLRALLATVPQAATDEARLAALAPDPALCADHRQLLIALAVGAPSSADAPRRRAEATVAALARLLAAQSRQRPQVLFIDDWQWADQATRELLHLLHQRRLPLMLLLTTRPPAAVAGGPPAAMPDGHAAADPELADAEFIALAPLADDEARVTVAELLPGSDPFLAAQIVERGGGNPLFIEELCHFAAGTAAPVSLLRPQGGSPGGQGSPAWLEGLIASRVARLPPGQRRVLDAAAVIGNPVPAWLLEQLADCPADHPDVRALATQDLLFPAGESGHWRFKHGITRDVVYGAVGLAARRSAHRRAAALLTAAAQAAPDPAAALAQSCEALALHHAGAGEVEQAARCATMAGDKAMAASSIDRARVQYRAAVDGLERLPPSPALYQAWRSVVRRLGLASVFDPAPAERPVFERAVARAREHHDAAGLAFAEYWLAYLDYALGETGPAVNHAAAALAAARAAGDARLEAQALALQGQALAAAGETVAALAALDAALVRIEAALPPGSRPPPGLAYMLACRASVLGDRGGPGDLEAARAGFERALQALPGPGHEVEGSVLCLRSNVHLWHGRWDDAAADAAAAQRVGERVRSLYLLAMARSLRAWADWQRDRDAAEVRTLAEAAAWLIGRDKRLFVSLNHGRLAEACAALGQPRAARAEAAAALRRWRKRDPLGAAQALRALVRLDAAAGAAGWPGRAARRLAWADRIAQLRDSAHERTANARCRDEIERIPGPERARR